ncbi:MAG: hypothetical protein FWH14_04775 [Oscillospiraceae bacterium]|nr:hypothetical protein [Oscillospiraceae bacterium]
MCNPANYGRGGNLPPVVITNCRDDRPRSSVVTAAGWSVGAAICRPLLPQRRDDTNP